MGASIFHTSVQMMAASGPIIVGLVECALTLPKKLAAAITGVTTGLADNVEALIEAILSGAAGAIHVAGDVASGGIDVAANVATNVTADHRTGGATDGAGERMKSGTESRTEATKNATKSAKTGTDFVIHQATHGVLLVVNPIVKQAAALLDIKDFLPKQFFSVELLGLPVGIVLFVFYFMYVWPVLLNLNLLFMPAELPIMHVGYWLGTLATCSVMVLLWVLALKASRVADGLIYFVQWMVNHAFRALLDKMLPVEKFDKPLKLLGEHAPKPSDLKEKLLGMCTLDFHLDLEEMEENSAAEKAAGMMHVGFDKAKKVARHIRVEEGQPSLRGKPDRPEKAASQCRCVIS